MREIKFRAWDDYKKRMIDSPVVYPTGWQVYDCSGKFDTLMQFTGLKDKNGDTEIYECDIIDSDGNVIGNQYETQALLEEKANLLIQGFGTKDWLTTYQKAVERGCHDA